jgi:hypothetical protein
MRRLARYSPPLNDDSHAQELSQSGNFRDTSAITTTSQRAKRVQTAMFGQPLPLWVRRGRIVISPV